MLIPENFAQVNAFWTGSAMPRGAQTTFAIEVPLSLPPQQVAELVEDAMEESGFAASLSTSVAITKLLVKIGPNDIGPSGEFAVNIPGEVGNEPVPPNTTLLVRKGTAFGGRHGSGRYFLPGLPEAQVSGAGIVSELMMGDYRSQQTAFLSALSLRNVPMFLLHADDTGELGPLEVTSLAPQSRVATQRRRLR